MSREPAALPALRRYQAPDRPSLIAAIDAVCGASAWMTTRCYTSTPAWEHALALPACPRHLLLVAEAGAQVVGWCRLFPSTCAEPVQVAELGIGLCAEWRQRGLGTRMMRLAVDFARRCGWARIDLTVHSDNEPARRLFAHENYVAAGVSANRHLCLSCFVN